MPAWLRRAWCMCGLLLAAFGAVVGAQQPSDLLGQTVTSIRFDVEGRPETPPAVAALSDVHVGQPLRREDVRATIAHLDSLGRYDDIASVATPVAGGVDVVFRLTPRHPVSRIEVIGETGVAAGTLKSLILQRYGGVPTGVRVSAVEATARQFLQDEGYLQATVTTRTELLHNPDSATLIFDVAAGAAARIGHTEVHGTAAFTADEVMRRTHATPGVLYRRRDIEAGLTALEDTLRGRGYYEAQTALQATQTAEGVDLAINVDPGPRVELRVTPEGSLPSGGVEELIPIRRLGAADQDLLEDAKARIERLLRADGYWKASAPFSRAIQENGQVLVITFTVTRGVKYFIDHVEWPRNLTLSEVSLREQVGVRDGDVFDEARFQAGLASVIGEYIKNGYYKATAQPAYEELPVSAGDRARVVLHPNITEGPRGQVREVTFKFSGAHQVSEATLRQAMRMRAGVPYVAFQTAQDRADLITLYRNEGFRSAFVDITPAPDPSTGREIALNVTVNEGPKVVIRQITVVGNQRTSEEEILKELRMTPGDPAGEAALNAAQRRLVDLGIFRRVTLSAPEQSAGSSDAHLIVTVVEAPATTLGYGGGLEGGRQVRTGADLNPESYLGFAPRGFFQIGRRNLGGRNRSLDFFSRVSFNRKSAPGDPTQDGRGFGFTEYRVSGTYRERHVWQSDADLLVSTTFEQAHRTNFNFLRKGVNAELLKALGTTLTVSGRYGLSSTRLFDQRVTDPKELPTIDRLFPQVRLSLFSGSVSWDRRNSPLATTRGTLATGEVEVAARAIGSQVGYAKVFLQGSGFHALGANRRTVLAGRAELGLAHGFPRVVVDPNASTDGFPVVNIVQDLPASQRFYAGGGTTVRGFDVDRLAVPEILTQEGLSQGGNGLVILNGELRRTVGQLLSRNFMVVGFVDTGNVFATASSLDFTRLRTAVGFGVRYDSPIGPIRLDFGFKVHPQIINPSGTGAGQRESSWAYHLSIGEAF